MIIPRKIHKCFCIKKPKKMFESERFQLIGKVRIWKRLSGKVCNIKLLYLKQFICSQESEELFSRLASSHSCRGKEMETWEGTDLRKVKSDDLTAVVTQLSSFSHKSYSDLTATQLDCLFTSIATSNELRLMKLKLTLCYLYACNADNLARALCRLHTVEFSKTYLTFDQATKLCSAIAEAADLKLQILKINCENFSSVPEDTLARVFMKLQRVHFSDVHLTSNQIIVLLSAIANSSELRLHSLGLEDCHISHVPEDTVAKAVCKLRTVDLNGTLLSKEQVTTMLNLIVTADDLPLSFLSLADNVLNLVDSDLIEQTKMKININS